MEPLPTDEVQAEDSHQRAAYLDNAGNEIPDQSTDLDDLPEVNMDRALRVTLSKELRYAPTLTELIRCRRHRDGTLQPTSLPKVGLNTPYPLTLEGTHRHTAEYTDVNKARI